MFSNLFVNSWPAIGKLHIPWDIIYPSIIGTISVETSPLSTTRPLVLEVDEFVDLLNKENITDYEKKEILSYIIKSNVDNYRKEN